MLELICFYILPKNYHVYGSHFYCVAHCNKNEVKATWGKPPFSAILTNTEFVCPPIESLNHAHHGTNSAALLPGCMWNRFLCVCHSGVGGRLIWNQLSGDQSIFTQSILPQIFSEVLSTQIAPLSHLLLPKLSTLVDCCFG